jgi:hypothetical protein
MRGVKSSVLSSWRIWAERASDYRDGEMEAHERFALNRSSGPSIGTEVMATSRKWQFKTRFRANAYGWRGSSLAISRLKEAASEIKGAAKSDSVAAGDGVVSLMERIWPAFQDIDTSSGALGTAVGRTLDELIPILADAPVDHATRSKWLERLFEAVQNDGVEYLGPVEERWGEIARYPDLIDEYADRLIATVRHAWADHQTFQHVIGTSICLSCLLESGRYAELQELLATRRHRFGAEALVRQRQWEAAIAFAEAVRGGTNSGSYEKSIDRFCENILIQHGRSDEAYRRYGLRAASGTTNLSVYRSLVRTYPDRDPRQMLLDLIETRGDKGKWFAAAKDAGFLDIAVECAAAHGADPSTLVRAARDFRGKDPRFAAAVALLALSNLLAGGGYDPQVAEAYDAVKHLLSASRQIDAVDWALQELGKLTEGPCAAGREPFQQAVKSALSRWDAGERTI